MDEDEAQRAELAAVIEADLLTSGARSLDEFTAAAAASVSSLLPSLTPEVFVERKAGRALRMTIRFRRARGA